MLLRSGKRKKDSNSNSNNSKNNRVGFNHDLNTYRLTSDFLYSSASDVSLENMSNSEFEDGAWGYQHPSTSSANTVHSGFTAPSNTPLSYVENCEDYLREQENMVRNIIGIPPRTSVAPPSSNNVVHPVTTAAATLTTQPNLSTATTLNYNAPLFVPPRNTSSSKPMERLSVFSNFSQPQTRADESSTDLLLKALLTKLDAGFTNIQLSLRTPQSTSIPRFDTSTNTFISESNAQRQDDSMSRLEKMVSSLGAQVQSLTNQMSVLTTTEQSESSTRQPHQTSHRRLPNQPSPSSVRTQRPPPTTYTYFGDSHRILPPLPHQWKVWYDGNNNNFPIEFFFDQLEILRCSSGLEYFHVIAGLPHLLGGEPARWFVRYSRENPGVEWDKLKTDMIKQFRGTDSEESLWCSIANRKQGERETFDCFYSALQNVQDRISMRFTDAQMMGILRNNVKYSIQKCLVSFSTHSLIEFVNKCRQIDKLLHPQLYFTGSTSRKVSELQKSDMDSDEPSFDVEAFASQRSNSSENPKCWNCEQYGHRFKDCEEPRRMFCYLCGYLNVTCNKCPSCSLKPNFRQRASHHVPPSAPPKE